MRRNLLRTRYLIILLSVFFLSSCNSVTDSRKEKEFRENRNLWQNESIENYRFEFSKLCYCGGLFNPATIVVKADTIHAVLDSETGEHLRDPQTNELVLSKYSESFLTIDELFEVIANAQTKADKLTVDYDQNLGYPVRVEIDYIKEAIDDEVTYMIDHLRRE